jgi:glycerol-3-phosphate acyltransferase PlsY
MPDPINLTASAPYFLAAFLFGYLLGSIPFGLLLTRMAGLGDVRSIGSGNIGATNVLRTGRKDIAAATLVLDAGKGLAAVLLAGFFGPGTAALAAIGALVGHCYPIWLRFKGGKGVATLVGVLIALSWPHALLFRGDLARHGVRLSLLLSCRAGGHDGGSACRLSVARRQLSGMRRR